ncbi:hypothetical protein RHMOL_Rhmol10G0162200 [Rhododendron molle]|uniref:Uncharacterized protein n=1 Tax=Rhododendron molle TaxID=49168 RepID=A0ACC0M314_RHOML|nr:hypothetical protein RHMOL_Rhmol10G0162200 [Rhododendron molle]
MPIPCISGDQHSVSVIVVKDSVDKGIVVKGPVVHALSNEVIGGQRSACEQSILGQVQSDSEEELLEVLEKVVSSFKEDQIVQVATPLKDDKLQQIMSIDPAVNPATNASISSFSKAEQPNPKPPDLLCVNFKEKASAAKQPLTKSAQKKLRKQFNYGNSYRFLEVSRCSIGLTNWGCRWDLPSQRGMSSACNVSFYVVMDWNRFSSAANVASVAGPVPLMELLLL